MKNKVSKSIANCMKKTLDAVLRTEANTTSCVIVYQPKAPKELVNFRRK